MIFSTYTGNAMLNNALMTIEALANFDSVSDISIKVLKNLYQETKLLQTNKRLKSYTMLFTKNGPLHNDKLLGEKHYDALMNTLFSNFENEGSKICEISGLRFEKSFSELNSEALRKIGVGQKEIQKKDTNIGRTWFPLIGGLGSDAQALPQAKYGVQIHPICIAIVQFLPLSAVLYKGGVLLMDSSNFELSKEMVRDNVKTLRERIESKSVTEQIENVKDFSKGNFVLTALNILAEKEDLHESFSDLNLWSFSNSGTGASCEIDRVPNSVIKKLQRLYNNTKISNELKGILSKSDISRSFLEALQDDKDWPLLYPNIFGSGKKSVKYEGVSPEFFESYYQEIGKSDIIPMAKYIAGLIKEYKSSYFAKTLEKTDAWRDPDFKVELYKVLLKATEEGKWTLSSHIAILDDKESLPLRNNYYNLQKSVYYFVYKDVESNEAPKIDITKSHVYLVCRWMISLIMADENFNKIKSKLSNPNEFQRVGYNRMFFSALEETDIEIKTILTILYNDNYYYQKNGLNELLRVYFSQPEYDTSNVEMSSIQVQEDVLFNKWKERIGAFAEDYRNYYYDKYKHHETGQMPTKKFQNLVNAIVNETNNFSSLLTEMIFNTNDYLRKNIPKKEDKWLYEYLMTDPLGNKNWNICVFTLKFLLKEIAVKHNAKEELETIN